MEIPSEDAKNGAVVGLIFGLVLSFFILLEVRDLKAKAVELGYAEYSSSTGKWQWKEKPAQPPSEVTKNVNKSQ